MNSSAKRTPLFFWHIAIWSVVLVSWFSRLRLSLWIDEFAVNTNYEPSLRAMTQHFFETYPVSPLYYFLMWFPIRFFGNSEFVLRFPSIICGVATLIIFYRLAKHLFDEDVAIASTLVLASHRLMLFAATNARPYGLALLLVISATAVFIRWQETGRLIPLISYVLLMAMLAYVQPLFITVVPVHLVYFFYGHQRSNSASLIRLMIALLLIGALLLPFAERTAYLWGQRQRISIVPTPNLDDLADNILVYLPQFTAISILIGCIFYSFRSWLKSGRREFFVWWFLAMCGLLWTQPTFVFVFFLCSAFFFNRTRWASTVRFGLSSAFIGILFCGLWLMSPTAIKIPTLDVLADFPLFPFFHSYSVFIVIAFAVWKMMTQVNNSSKRQTVFAATLFLFPLIFLFLVSNLTAAKIFFLRYFMLNILGSSLLVGWAITQIHSIKWRTLALTLVVVGSIVDLRIHLPDFQREDWRQAARTLSRYVKSDTPIYINSGFVESNYLQGMQVPFLQKMMASPITYYALDGQIKLLPMHFGDHEMKGYMFDLLKPARMRVPRIVLMLASGDDGRVRWMDKYLKRFGYREVKDLRFGISRGVVYKCRSSNSDGHQSDDLPFLDSRTFGHLQ